MAILGQHRWLGFFGRHRAKLGLADVVHGLEVQPLTETTEGYQEPDGGLNVAKPIWSGGATREAAFDAAVEALRLSVEQGDLEQAISLFDALLNVNPDCAAIYKLGATALHAAGRASEAYEVLRTAEDRFPVEAWPLQSKIEFFQKDGNWYEIGECAARLRLVAPDAPDGYRLGLTALQRRNRLAEIGPLIESAMKMLPEEEWLLEASVVQQLRDGRLLEATQSGDRLRQLYPDNVAGYREAGVALRRLGRFDDADGVLQDASRRFASSNWIDVESAWLALRRGRLDEAGLHASKARGADPGSYPGYMIAVEALRRGGQLDKAQALLTEAAAKLEKTAWLAGEAALIAEARLDHDEASRIWQSVRNDHPDDLAGYLGGVRTARGARRLGEAESIFLEGRGAFGGSAALLTEGAHVAELSQAFDAAAERWAALRTLEPENEAAYRHGMDVAEALGRTDLALSLLHEAIAQFPASDWLVAYRARLVPSDRAEMSALEASQSKRINPRLVIVSKWQDCVDTTLDLLSGTQPCFLGRIGGSDTNAVAASLTNLALGGDATHPNVMAHLKIVERYNGYYDRDGDPANFLRYLQVLTDCYAAAANLFFCNYQLLSLYFQGNLDQSFYRSDFDNKVGFQLLCNDVLGRGGELNAYPYTFVEKLASHSQTLMNVLAKTLKGKRVLVISPFSKSIQANFHNRRTFFKNYDYPEFGLQVFNTPITYAGLPSDYYPDRNWFETTEAMLARLSKMDFDVALLSCGSYAMPIGQHIATKMGKQAIYIGGVLQLMFGIMGRRYNNKFILDQINPRSFINPVEAKDYLGHVAIAPETAHEAFGAYF